ncbi:MAG: hypothetical protein Q8L36_02970 [bacterium]|nr:hypothetical protein [bacterium]
MTFRINNLKINLLGTIRDIGYKPLGWTEKKELNCVRPLGGDYPRFHLYVREEPERVVFNLHLDQKKPVYQGVTAHSGDYDTEVVKEEAERIKNKLTTND